MPTTYNTRQRFSFYCDEWLRAKKDSVRESTYVKYETILRKHIKPKLGASFPAGINDAVTDAFTHELLTKDKLSVKSVQDILSVLHGAMKYAAKRFSVPFVRIDIRYPRETKKETRVLSHDEQRCLAKYLLSDIDSCKFGVLLMLLTGMRIGELSALKWGDINIAEKTVCIKATLQRLHDADSDGRIRTKILIGAPKSGTSIRHKLIRPYTPRHNGKVERSHREDQKRFYSCHAFYSLDDFAKQLAVHNRRSNNFPMRPLHWLSPAEFSVQYV